MISLEDEDAKTEYIMEEVNDWLNRVWTFRGEEALDELLEQWIETTHEARVNDIQTIEKIIDTNLAIYMPYAWQWNPYQDMLYLGDELEVNLYEITVTYLEKV